MRKLHYLAPALTFGVLLMTLGTAAHADEDARALVKRVLDAVPNTPFTAKATLTSDRGWVRELELSHKRVGDVDAAYMEVTSPMDLKDTRFLLFDRVTGRDEQYIYVPTAQARRAGEQRDAQAAVPGLRLLRLRHGAPGVRRLHLQLRRRGDRQRTALQAGAERAEERRRRSVQQEHSGHRSDRSADRAHAVLRRVGQAVEGVDAARRSRRSRATGHPWCRRWRTSRTSTGRRSRSSR